MLDFFFSSEQIWFTVLEYPVSGLEFLGVLTALACVVLTAMEKVSSWPIGMVNNIFFFVLFYQVQLYSDMILQVFFFVVSIAGWYAWTHPRTKEESKGTGVLKITALSWSSRIIWVLGIGVFTLIWGFLISQIHLWLPLLFPEAAAFPYWDALTTVMSIGAFILQTRKILESWVLWIMVDIVAVSYYLFRGVQLVALEYAVFGIIATLGLIGWIREMRRQSLAQPIPTQGEPLVE